MAMPFIKQNGRERLIGPPLELRGSKSFRI
jgi:hypothetical protein